MKSSDSRAQACVDRGFGAGFRWLLPFEACLPETLFSRIDVPTRIGHSGIASCSSPNNPCKARNAARDGRSRGLFPADKAQGNGRIALADNRNRSRSSYWNIWQTWPDPPVSMEFGSWNSLKIKLRGRCLLVKLIEFIRCIQLLINSYLGRAEGSTQVAGSPRRFNARISTSEQGSGDAFRVQLSVSKGDATSAQVP
jgi:hypothetical protein